MSNSTVNDTLNPIWIVYTSVNAVACTISFLAILSYRSQQLVARDVFNCLLFIEGICLSFPLFVQSIVNIKIHQISSTACNLQAFLITSSILTIFYTTVLISWNFQRTILLRKQFPLIYTYAVSGCQFVFSQISVAVLGNFSDIIITPSGSYCFYHMTSPVIIGWLFPTFIISLILISYWYNKIYREIKSSEAKVKASLPAMSSSPRNHPSSPRNSVTAGSNGFIRERVVSHVKRVIVRKQFIHFVALFLVCWIPISINIFYTLDILLILSASVHSILAPIVYLYLPNPKRKGCFLKKNVDQKFRVGSLSKLKADQIKRVTTPRMNFPNRIELAEIGSATRQKLQITIHNVPAPVIAIERAQISPIPQESSSVASPSEGKQIATSPSDAVSVQAPSNPHDSRFAIDTSLPLRHGYLTPPSSDASRYGRKSKVATRFKDLKSSHSLSDAHKKNIPNRVPTPCSELKLESRIDPDG